MPDQETIERIQQEVVSANKDRLYQATKKEVDNNKLQVKPKPEYTSAEVKSKHHNWLLDQSINKELTLADYINVEHKSLFERLKGFFK